MNKSKKQLAKIYYQNREVNYIEIMFDDLCHTIDIGTATHISGKDEIITMDYDFIDDDDKKKESRLCYWQIDNHLDKVQVIHSIDSGIMIEWLSYEGNVKSSLFIPMERILHIHVDNPKYDYEYEQYDKEIIDR
jgi:hypothetical protein